MLTTEQMGAARAAAKKINDKARAFTIFDHPFFCSVMMKKKFVEDFSCPTMAVTPDGNIYFNPVFVATLQPDNQVFNIAHEVLHYLGGHEARYKNYCAARAIPALNKKNRFSWNKAADYWINDTLVQANVGVQTPGTLCRPGSAARIVEDIMDEVMQEADDGGEGGSEGADNPGPMEGDMHEGDGELSDSEIEATRKLDAAEAAQLAKMKGKLPGVLAQFATDAIDSKTPWYDVLERHMVERIKVDTNWAKPNRRYAPDFYMPTADSEGAMGELVVQVDISGSVSQQEIRYYNGHLKRIVEQCRPKMVHVIYTDITVQKHEEFEDPDDMRINFYSGGGTDMRAGFKYLKEKGINPEVVVTLTDGYTPFPDKEDVPTIWCISSKGISSPTGTTIHFDMNDGR